MSQRVSAQQIGEMVQNIRAMGLPFTEEQIRQALHHQNYSQENAVNYLLEYGTQPPPQQQQQQPVAPVMPQMQPVHNPYTPQQPQQAVQQQPQVSRYPQQPATPNTNQQVRPSNAQQQQRQQQFVPQSSEEQIQAAIQASLTQEPMALDRRQRKPEVPVGLKNVGNTCYFNSFIQAFFFLPNMSDKLLQTVIKQGVARGNNPDEEMKNKRIVISQQMVRELQILFGKLLYTNQSYVDPSSVLNNVVDESGRQCPVGEQQDSMEYLLNFMERLEEGLSEVPGKVQKNMRVSTFLQDETNRESSFLMDFSDLAFSSQTDEESSRSGTQATDKQQSDYGHIDDSYFSHATTQEKPPVNAKPNDHHLNTIQENFFGSNTNVTKLLNKDTQQEKVISKHNQKMGPIMLDIDSGYLMDDWENASRTEVSDYKAGASEVCINESWVKEPPNILIFTLNRVKYDKKAQKLVKDFKKFKFDKVIHADQQLEGNIGRIDGVRKKTRRLKEEIKRLEAELEALREDKTLDSLTHTVTFLQGQLANKNCTVGESAAVQEESKDGESVSKSGANMYSNLEGMHVEKAHLEAAINLLASYQTMIERKQAIIKHQIQEMMEQQSTAFADYCNMPYYLHAILIHDGTAESGHYYSFIYDRKQDCWWRFSDINVSLEIEDVVFREAFGGQAASTKTAYSLIYINEFCKHAMEEKLVAPFLMGNFMNVDGDLRNRMTIENNSFIQAQEQFLMKKTSDSIRRRYHDKHRQVIETSQQMDQILDPKLINFIFYLQTEKKQVFTNWCVLNQAVIEELGGEMGGLRSICKMPENGALLRELESGEFKQGFLNMSDKDELALNVHKKAFKHQKRRYQIATFALQTFSNNIFNWKAVHSAIQWMKNAAAISKQKNPGEDSLDLLMLDLMKVYILECLTTTMKMVLVGQGDQAQNVYMGAVIACYQFLPRDDPITKQAIKYTDRIIDVCKRIPTMVNFKLFFGAQITKMKRPDKLQSTDFVQAEIPAELVPLFDQIRVKNEELADFEIWNTESLCFTYFNILQQYKATKSDWIGWLRACKNGPASDKEVQEIERRCTINLSNR